MKRLALALSFAAIMTFALPAFAGPNGAVAPSFFPVYKRHVSTATKNEPHALLGETADEGRPANALRPGIRGKSPARTFLRRPSEGR